MNKEKMLKVLQNNNVDIKSLGIYVAIILVMFSLGIPFIEKTINQQTEKSSVPAAAEVKNAAELALKERDNSFSEYTIDDIKFNDQPEVVFNKPAESEQAAGLKEKEASSPAVEASAPVPAKPNTTKEETESAQIIWPLAGKVIQKMGFVYSETFGDYRYHNGIDIQADEGSKVLAVWAGQVEKVETSKADRTVIWLKHQNGWRSCYAHLEATKIKAGDTVKAGQEIGIIGHPGQNEALAGPHLHFVLEKSGQAVDPLNYLP